MAQSKLSAEHRIDRLNKNLEKAAKLLEDLKNSGIDEDVWFTYVKSKTGISIKNIKKIMESTEDFLRKLSKEYVQEKL